jgi:molybdopterin-dependent oxidoreductase alpha subunit
MRVGPFKLARAMRTRNACKTCALGMGGQKGGMVNELGHWPEFCKKSLQAMAADMQGAVDGRFFETYSLRALGAMSPRELETSGRLVRPLHAAAGASHYREIEWDAALGLLADKLRQIRPEEAFFYFSGRSSNEAAFLLALFARVYGSNHVNNCSYYCHQASGVGLSQALGTGTATVQAGDIENTDVFFLFGGNPASNHPRLMSHLLRLRRRGGRVVVVNPVRETGLVNFRVPSDPRSLLFGSEMASDYVQVHIGGDVAFMTGMAKALLAFPGALDASYVEAHTEGFEASRQLVEATSWSGIEAQSGVARAEIERIAAIYAGAGKAIFAWTMGLTHHLHGVQNVHWLCNLALMRGMVGRPAAGLLPLRGHSNVQGLGSIGVTPALKDAALKRFVDYGVRIPEHKGHDTMATMEAAHAGRYRVGIALGGNLYGSNPDAAFAAEALSRVDLLVYLNTSLNTGHAHGLGRETLVLPVLARDEEPYATTQESMFSYVRLSDGGQPRHVGPRAELDLVAELGSRVLGDTPLTRPEGGAGPERLRWSELGDADRVRGMIADLVPELAELRDIGHTKREFLIPGRALVTPAFQTSSGRARFHAAPLPVEPEPRGGFEAFPLKLMTVRSEGQFNSVVYEDGDFYRGQERRDVVLISPEDMASLGLRESQAVTVRSEVGSLADVIVRSFAIKPGNALMYYPEANALVPRRVDPASRTPAFKCARIRIEAGLAAVPAGPARVAARGGLPVAALPALLGWLLWWRKRRRRPALKSC